MDKVEKCRSLIDQALAASRITLRNLQSLIGTLNFACAVISPGRPFLRKLINLTININCPYYYIRLTADTKKDLMIWKQFLHAFNGKSLVLYREPILATSLHLYTDAAQSIGFGATFGTHWIQGKWPPSWKELHISVLEFYPILVSATIWAHLIKNHTIIFHSDNMAVVQVINSKTSKCPFLLHLLRQLVLISLQYNINFRAMHVPGIQNTVADALSRFQEMPHHLALQLDQLPATIPDHLQPTTFNW